MYIDIEKLGLDLGSGQTVSHEPQCQDHQHELASLIAYMIGVGPSLFGQGNVFDDVFSTYEKDDNLKVIRALSALRTSLMRGISRVSKALKEGTPLHSSIYIDEDLYSFLSRKNIIVNKARKTPPVNYIIECNKVIKERIGNCRNHFPSWVPWDYISRVFIMPFPVSDPPAYGEEITKFHKNMDRYPFKCYIYWPGNPEPSGNILSNDEKFTKWLYECNGQKFQDTSKVKDIRTEKREAIYSFLDRSTNVVALVDCENTDPYRLFAAFRGLSTHTDKITRLILVDDPNTASIWRSLENLLPMPVVHIMTERVSKAKSLVDHRLIIQAMQEYYENQVDSFIIVSSDSDFSELIRSLKADFIVFLDRERVGYPFISFLQENMIPFCSIDEFLSKSGDKLKAQFLCNKIEEKLEKIFENGMDDIVLSVLKEEYLTFTDTEKKELLKSIALGTKISFTEGKAQISVSIPQ